MIEPQIGSTIDTVPLRASSQRKVFRMDRSERSDRINGSVPVWETPRRQRQHIEQALTSALTGDTTRAASVSTAMAYQSPHSGAAGKPLQEFGFADLIDIVNPLQHIPIIGHIYRELTGDTIKPIGQIMGGALFGGPLGAAGGLVNAIVREETGRDITGNAIALVEGDEIAWKDEPSHAPANPAELLPEELLETQPVKVEQLAAIPAAAPSFAPSAAPTPRPASAPALKPAPDLEIVWNTPRPAAIPAPSLAADHPQSRLNRAAREIESAAYRALPPAVLGFADSGAAAAQSFRNDRSPAPGGTEWRKRERYND